jgi:hypothetical protein
MPFFSMKNKVLLTLSIIMLFALHTNAQSSATIASLHGDEEKQVMDYLKKGDVANDAYNAKIARLYKMANFFTRLRLYPLAMKCFLRTLAADSLHTTDLPLTNRDDSLFQKQELFIAKNNREINSRPVHYQDIIHTFEDGKQAVAYALVFHVKQPVRGQPKVHKLAYTGHTFITLIKYNADSSYTSASFGFFPKKDNPLSATPVFPSTSSTFKDDAEHDWDEVIGKFISRRRFEKILRLTEQYGGLRYHLSKNNCSDFGLKAADLAGLSIWDTKGKWLLGGGNNPGNTGQSILNGKFSNRDSGNYDGLYIDTLKSY